MLLESILRRMIRHGDLEAILPGNRRVRLGDGTGPALRVRLTDPAWAARIVANPSMAFGEAYMAGAVSVEGGGVYELLDLLGRNLGRSPNRPPPGPLRRWWADRARQRNDRRAARRNAVHHYDLSADFYRQFLDSDLQYSCAYFERPEASLEEAQAAKKRHIAAKLLLSEGQRVLDIGCGWGGMGLTLAAEAGVSVDGVTLAGEQARIANARAEATGLAARARFCVTDYRDVAGPYDRIVSVGMFEHVGRPNFQAYFDHIARLLTDDGVAVIHAIGRSEGPSTTQPWIARYIFPGGYIPALSEVLPAVERSGLLLTDVEILRLHYAETLRAWRGRFAARREEIAALYDERFCRMWEFYLAASEAAFRRFGHMVFQLQLAKRIDTVPMTRDYISHVDKGLAPPPRQVA